MNFRQATLLITLLIVLMILCGCSTMYLNGPGNYRVKLNTVLQSNERYISILLGSGKGETQSDAILSAAKNVSEQQKALGWESYDLRLLKQSFEVDSDRYECTQMHLVYERL